MDRLFVKKEEGVADVIERLLEKKEVGITIVVPKDSALAESKSNFHILEREQGIQKKRLTIESVDERVLALAREAELEAVHPLFDEEEGKEEVSDIVSRSSGKPGKRNKGGRQKKEVVEEDPPLDDDQDEEKEEEEYEEDDDAFLEETEPLRRQRRRLLISRRMAFMIVALGIVVFGLFWSATALFAHAEILLRFDKTPWEHSERLSASVTAKEWDGEKNVIPAQFFEEKKTVTQFFPASGKSEVSEKAKGMITVYNAYSSESQILVATTRFETPDGKIFRLDDRIIVPGAKIIDGKIEASSITASVTADKAGPEYNVSKVEKLSIPGFRGSPRFAGFYGSLDNGTKGGFVGEKAVATQKDVADARARVEEILKNAFNTVFMNSVPGNLRVLDTASEFEIEKVSVDTSTDEEGKFSVLGTGVFRAVAFREDDVVSLFSAKARADREHAVLQDVSLSYEDVKTDFSSKEMSFGVNIEGVLAPEFDADVFRAEAAGKSETELRQMILALPDILDAKVSLRPAWLRNAPKSGGKIDVVVE